MKRTYLNDNLKLELRRLLELHDSSDKAITRREIKRILNYHNDRQLRLMIHELRHDPVNGLPILFNTGNPAGYYVPSTRADLEKGLKKWWAYLYNFGQDYRDAKRAGERWLIPATQRKLL